MNRRGGGLACSFGPVLAVVVVACSSQGALPPPFHEPDADVPEATPFDAHRPSDGSSPESSTDASETSVTESGPPPCNALTADGPVVTETVATGSPPSAMGGTMAPGTYQLTEFDVYASSEGDSGATGSGNVHQRTLVLTATTMQMVQKDGPANDIGPPSTSTAGYAAFPPIVSLTQSCPSAEAAINDEYSVMGNDLWLFPTPEQRLVFTLM